MHTMKSEPLVDATVLGRYYTFATDAALETAIKELRLELDVREARREVGRHAKARDAERAAEVRDLIDSINAEHESRSL